MQVTKKTVAQIANLIEDKTSRRSLNTSSKSKKLKNKSKRLSKRVKLETFTHKNRSQSRQSTTSNNSKIAKHICIFSSLPLKLSTQISANQHQLKIKEFTVSQNKHGLQPNCSISINRWHTARPISRRKSRRLKSICQWEGKVHNIDE